MTRSNGRVLGSVIWLITVVFAAELFGAAAEAQPSLSDADRARLAEAFALADDVGESVWPGWSAVPFAVLLITDEHEFLIRHPRPTDEFERVAEFDSTLQSEVYARARQFSPGLLATFPAVGGVSTVVVGQPRHTGKSSTFWVITLLHEHFHQLQNASTDYYAAVDELDLSGGDETGMSMLNYPFPYDSEVVSDRFTEYVRALERAIAAARSVDAGDRLGEFLSARERLRGELADADYRYLSFQLWHEGVARQTEVRVADAAAELHDPLPAFAALDDVVSYASAAESLRMSLAEELSQIDLAESRRVAFYPAGAGEAVLLDILRPGWRRHYMTDRFYLERYYTR